MAAKENETRDLKERLKGWKYSLFTDFSDEEIARLRTVPLDEDMWYTDANFNAAIFILKKEWESKIRENIDFALQKNPKSIHAMCNKGLFCLAQRPPLLEEAKKAAKKIEELLKEEKPAKDAQLEQAYWLHTHKRSIESRTKGLKTFKESLLGVPPYDYTHYYYYKKILSSEDKKWKDLKERIKIRQCIVDQLTILKGSKEQIYELEVWCSLAELQRNPNVWKGLQLTSLLEALQIKSVDLLQCVDKMIEIMKSGDQSKIYSNYYARAGDAVLKHSLFENEKKKRVELLDRALAYLKESQEIKPSPIERGPNLYAEVLLWKWAIQYYEEHEVEVKSYVERMDQPYKVFTFEGKARYWSYLVRCFYTLEPDSSTTTRHYLEEAKTVIREAMIPGCAFAPMFYPRILMLLGDKHEDVEKSFDHIWIHGSYKQLYKSDKGLFYETIGEKEKAKECYEAVIKDLNESDKKHSMNRARATNGLYRVK
ncbi:uncharacterized protein [Watersipora subatra]|uniref:uncharacterized protein n=1 Tax=Watersipora subatra TaxID=2589382 RepID=UPI00355BC5AE